MVTDHTVGKRQTQDSNLGNQPNSRITEPLTLLQEVPSPLPLLFLLTAAPAKAQGKLMV